MMDKKINNKKPRAKKRFLAVDVWQKEFSQVSVRAVFDVFATTFRIEDANMKKYSFSECVNALRLEEDPDYIKPGSQSV